MAKELARLTGMPKTKAQREVTRFAKQNPNIPKKDLIANGITKIVHATGHNITKAVLQSTIKGLKGRLLKCYAGSLTENRAGHVKGYPARFEEPEMFPGRTAAAAVWKDLQGTDRPEKPWLNGLPRLIFVSDMGDALCSSIPFEYLQREIVEVCTSPKGTHHIWLWLTKRPARMAQFSAWLRKRGIAWPDNLVAMTTVTSAKTLSRVAELRKVKCRLRGLSVEPLWSAVKLPLDGIQWVIIGGESGTGAEPFHLEWARDIREQCHRAGVAFFMKQLGRRPMEGDSELRLHNTHGGDWAEWPQDLRVRETPKAFRLTIQQ
jgi:protein gp37